MATRLKPDTDLIKLAFSCKCPKCREGKLFKPGLKMEIYEKCQKCGLPLAENDSGDGPAVFMIFILGFLLVPLALLFEKLVTPPLWVHGVLWGIVAIIMTVGALKPLKTYIIALQYKHRPGDWK